MTGLALHVEGLTKVFRSFRQPAVTAVDGLSFSVRAGETVGLLGANGAGKTTTIKCICGLVRPTSGRVAVGGADTRTTPNAASSRLAAVLEGNRNVYWRLTARENLEFFSGLQGIPTRRARPTIDSLLRQFGLEQKADTPARMLSRGMQQKLALCAALVRGTELLILDEPTLGLDVTTSHELRGSLRRMGVEGQRTILLSSHDMQVVEALCDRVVVIHGGRVVADEKVPRLLDLFRSRSYRVVLEGALSIEQEERLRACFPAASLGREAGQSWIEVEARDGRPLYPLLEHLRGEDAVVASVDRRRPTLEKAFLALTGARAADAA